MTSAVAIVAFDGAQILDIAAPMEVLRSANLALKAKGSGRAPGYEKSIVATQQGPVDPREPRSGCAGRSTAAWT